MQLWDQAIRAEVDYRRERLADDRSPSPGRLLAWWRRRRDERRLIDEIWANPTRGRARRVSPAVGGGARVAPIAPRIDAVFRPPELELVLPRSDADAEELVVPAPRRGRRAA